MEDDQARRIIAVLEQIRDGQKEALARQAETMALLRERMASAPRRPASRRGHAVSGENHRTGSQGKLASHHHDLSGDVLCPRGLVVRIRAPALIK
jgi:hypothetical protein